jgi:hypothetical protein
MRAKYNTLPLKQVPNCMIYEMTKSSVFWLNAFPSSQEVSQVLSQRSIIIGQTLD